MPDHDVERVIHTLSPLRAVGCLLASTTLSKRHQKAKLRKISNTMQLCLPVKVNATTLEANMIHLGEQDKAGIVYPNVDPLVISAKIMGTTIKWLLVNCGAFANILFKTFYELGDYHDYIKPSEHLV